MVRHQTCMLPVFTNSGKRKSQTDKQREGGIAGAGASWKSSFFLFFISFPWFLLDLGVYVCFAFLEYLMGFLGVLGLLFTLLVRSIS